MHVFPLCVLDFLKRPLEQYVRRLEVPVRVVRMEQRSGLIRARLKGASISTGQVSHDLDHPLALLCIWCMHSGICLMLSLLIFRS